MRHVFRKVLIFPLCLLVSPLLLFIGWCMFGWNQAIKETKGVLRYVWDGE